ncbi:MAG TPA: cobalamin-independent methionine synthase II family protein [Pseudolysinimonas sp.]|nr:cobalamin-independent methionine synthase II family protein [Pseudolysinimonas sp.]
MSRILTTHVGSLIRPPELVDVLRARDAGTPVDQATFDATLRKSVVDVVAQQAETGIDVVSDGEFGKTLSWARYIRDRIGGFEQRTPPPSEIGHNVLPGTDKQAFPEFYDDYEKSQGFTGTITNWVCTGPITYTGLPALQRDIADLKAGLAEVDVTDAFLPVVAPASVVPIREDEYYATEQDFVFAMADALNVEYRAIVDAGLMVQIDDAYLATMYDTMMPHEPFSAYRDWAELRIEALIRALDGIPAERAKYHVCWGSWNAPHTGDVPLADIADLILRVPVSQYAIEQANPRHEHEWQVWKDVKLPEGRKLVPGVIAHTTNVVEHPELVAERIVRLAEIVGRDNVIAGTDCGFAQGPYVQRVHPTIQWAKLRALTEGARLASERLWR